jgi:glutamate 5-kinase
MSVRDLPSLAAARRIVVKIGSALLVDAERAAPRADWLASVAADIAELRERGAEVLVVSSGAIALARRTLRLTAPRLRLEEKQAAAAVGQIRLAQAWSEALSARGMTAAQLLLTSEDTEDRRRYLNARATLTTLIGLGCVPVINENDTVATAEIRFGDNDRLAARVAEMVQADVLVLLSDIDGLYTADPRRDPAAAHIPVVGRLTPEIEAMGGEPPPGYSSGGMRTKLAAARIATGAGVAMAIAVGGVAHPLRALSDGARCTWFLASPEGHTARKRWILGTLQPVGGVVVDAGAARALVRGGSLLPAGVRAIEGAFERGDAIEVRGPGGAMARGLSAYASADAVRIIGHRSEEIEAILGWRGRDELIHRDDLVLLEPARARAAASG